MLTSALVRSHELGTEATKSCRGVVAAMLEVRHVLVECVAGS